jgi:hypothetical protein
VLERAFGKPKDYDPADEPKPKRDRLDTSRYSDEPAHGIGRRLAGEHHSLAVEAGLS